MIVELGDPHNFGRKVTLLSNGLIHKPRSMVLEKTFLDSTSSFRIAFDKKLQENFGPAALTSIFADLTFSELVGPLYAGEVSKLVVDEVEVLSSEILIKTGILIAVCSYFGIGDLHDQNMAVGRVRDTGNFICSPLDIECIFSLCRLPSQTLLIPSKYATDKTCGLKDVLKLLPESRKERHASLVQILFAYLKTLELLSQDKSITKALLSSLPQDLPIRVIIRDTQVYYDHLKRNKSFAALLSEELQLKRGDIPFFYRKYFSSDVLWLAENSHDIWQKSQVIEGFDFHKDSKEILESSLLQGNHPCLNDLTHAASLQLVRNLLPSSDETLTSVHEGYRLETNLTNIKITNPKGLEWSCAY